MYRLSDKVCSYEAGYGDGDFHHERYGSLLPVDGQKGRGHSSKSHTYQLDSDDEGSSRSSGLRSTLLGHVEYENHDQSVISSKKGKVRGSAGSKAALPPYQTMMIKVLTQCEECVRKVKKAVAHAEGVESINVDMDLKKITIRGHLDPQKVMKKASKTGKSVEFLSSKGSTIKSAPMYDQQEAKGGNFSLKHDFPRSPSDNIYGMDGFPKSTGDQKTYKKGLENNYQQIMRGVSRLNLTPEDKPTNNDMKISATKKNAMEYKHGINVNAPNTKEKLQHDHHQQNSEVMPGHSIESDHHPRHPLLDQESSYFQSSGGKKLKLKQKQQDHDKHISSELSKQSFTYPASRDEGSYIFSDENPNNCCIM